MAQQFAGLCVGGPLAGQSMVRSNRSTLVEERPVISLGDPGDPLAETACVTQHIYNWHHTGAQGFWIPEGHSLHDAINTLAMAYVEKCNAGR